LETHYATIWEAIADAMPDRLAIVAGDVRRSWGQYEDRSARLAQVLLDHGLESGDKVGLLLYNGPEYAESQFAAFKNRQLPVNINYRYHDDELVYLLDNADATALVFHSSFGDRVGRVLDRLPKLQMLLEVADSDGHLDKATRFEDALAGAAPAPRITRAEDDEVILYTGGTTGYPKGVRYAMGAHCGMFLQNFPMILGLEGAVDGDGCVARAVAMRADDTNPRVLSAVPLMHGQGLYMGLLAPHLFGGTCVLTTSRSFDAKTTLDVATAERVQLLVIVGDAIALPLVRDLDERAATGDALALPSLQTIMSSGAMFTAELKERLLAHLPHVVIADGLGSTEAGAGVSFTMAGMTTPTATFIALPGTKVFNDAGTEVTPGSGEVGRIAVADGAALGYYKDDERSAATFQVVDGVRYTVAGDQATVNEDGSIVLLGRGSGCINTAGEKVWPEEVEEAMKRCEAIDDALVFGVEDERLGQRIVAVASLAPAAEYDAAAVIARVRDSLATYKAPKEVVFLDEVPRTPTGKPDYAVARARFEDERRAVAIRSQLVSPKLSPR
jgi:acyl-CoA synthetase (AMP-forming)/AMP-acid ligase II